jgi:hypothetical protein
MTDDLLPDIQPSPAPALESARRESDRLRRILETDIPNTERDTLHWQWLTALERVADLERQQMEAGR